jgi:glycine/D-amino acid oxidase-like deaminating enzyme
MSNKIVIVGAGIAGVSCYKYLKSRGYDVVIVEASGQIGGNVQDSTVDKHTFDVASLEVFDWYHYFRETFPEIFEPVNGVVFNDNRVLKRVINVGGRYTTKLLKTTTQNVLKGLSELEILDNLNWYKEATMRYYEQPLPIEGLSKNMGTVMKMVGANTSFFESCAYGPCQDQDMYFFLPTLTRAKPGSFMFSEYVRCGGIRSVLRSAVAPEDIMLNTKVKSLTHHHGRITLITTQGSVECDKVVLTLPFGQLHRSELKLVGHPVDPKSNWYTKYFSFTVEVLGSLAVDDFDAGFEKQDPDMKYQIVSYFSTESMCDSVGLRPGVYVMFVVDNTSGQNLSKHDTIAMFGGLPKPLMFENASLTVLDVSYFPHAMPVMDPWTVVAMKKAQGKNGVYYAGQYMGHPSMETACYTGKLVASMISGKKLSPSVRDVNKKHFGPMMLVFDTNAYALVGVTSVLTAIIILKNITINVKI